jgi:acetyl-CoA acetyltransferase
MPAFAKGGTITAANASSISDGAAALVMTRHSVAAAMGLGCGDKNRFPLFVTTS